MAKIVVTFGRFNPPTAGHHLLAKTVMDRAADLGADHMIYGSMSTDPKKNPLTAEQKAKHMSRVLGTGNVHVGEGARNPFEMLKHLSDRGYKMKASLKRCKNMFRQENCQVLENLE
jgi:phosphopantetheine adenylyltransferase